MLPATWPSVGPAGHRVWWGIAAFVIGYQLFVPPFVGLSDTGDMQRNLLTAGLFYPEGAPSAGPRSGHVIPEFRLGAPVFEAAPGERWKRPALTSEALVLFVARGLHAVAGKVPSLDVRFVGLAHFLFFLAGLGLLLEGVTSSFTRGGGQVAAGLIVLVFTDVGYVSYLNTAYGDAAVLAFLPLVVGTALKAIATRRPAWFLAFAASALLLLTAKPQNAPLCVPLAAMSALLGAHTGTRRRWRVVVVGLLLTAAGLVFQHGSPANLRNTNIYSSIFTGILPHVEDPAAAMKELGLDPRLEKYVGKYYWGTATGPREDPVFQVAFADRFGFAPVLAYHVAHPAVTWRLCVAAGRWGFDLKVPYMGHFTAASGEPPFTHSEGFSFWSDFKSKAMPHSLGTLLAVAAAGVGLAVASLRGGDAMTRARAWLLLAVAVMAALQFLICVMGDGLEAIARHLFFFNALWDLMFITVSAAVVEQGVLFLSPFLQSATAALDRR